MPITRFEGLEIFRFDNLQRAGLVHGIFSRQGGVSPAPWEALNTGSLVGDEPERVAENLGRAARALGRPPETLVTVRQIHGTAVHRQAAPHVGNTALAQVLASLDRSIPEADAILTDSRQPTLFMRFADCVPVLYYDPVRQVAAIAHAGWRGIVSGIAAETVAEMRRLFGSQPADIAAGIGPSICVDHYEVGPEVVAAVRDAFGDRSSRVLRPHGEKAQLDLETAVRLQLEAAGVGSIEISGECTAERIDRWFSHRAEKGRTGRFAALAGIA